MPAPGGMFNPEDHKKGFPAPAAPVSGDWDEEEEDGPNMNNLVNNVASLSVVRDLDSTLLHVSLHDANRTFRTTKGKRTTTTFSEISTPAPLSASPFSTKRTRSLLTALTARFASRSGHPR